jgi:hypothetical protein
MQSVIRISVYHYVCHKSLIFSNSLFDNVGIVTLILTYMLPFIFNVSCTGIPCPFKLIYHQVVCLRARVHLIYDRLMFLF